MEKYGRKNATRWTNEADAVIAAMTIITELVGSVFDVMKENPLLTVFLAAGLLTVGISIFTQLK